MVFRKKWCDDRRPALPSPKNEGKIEETTICLVEYHRHQQVLHFSSLRPPDRRCLFSVFNGI